MFNDIKKMTALNLAVIFFIGLDRLLKILALKGYELKLIGELLSFNYKANYYIAFSLPLYGVWLNAIILIIILSLIYYLSVSWRRRDRLTGLCLLTVVLGASSNLFDRLKYGWVIDYLDLKYFTVFNLADALIAGGVVILLISIYKKEAG